MACISTLTRNINQMIFPTALEMTHPIRTITIATPMTQVHHTISITHTITSMAPTTNTSTTNNTHTETIKAATTTTHTTNQEERSMGDHHRTIIVGKGLNITRETNNGIETTNATNLVTMEVTRVAGDSMGIVIHSTLVIIQDLRIPTTMTERSMVHTQIKEIDQTMKSKRISSMRLKKLIALAFNRRRYMKTLCKCSQASSLMVWMAK